MRKALGMSLAVASLLSMIVVAAGPAGSATKTPLTCKTLKGTVTWTPPVPATGAAVLSNVKATITVSGCTGTPGITSGVISFTSKGTTKHTCATQLTDKGNVKASASTKWNNGKTSVSPLVTLKYVSVGAYVASGKIASGTAFVGQSTSAQTQYIPVGGGCLTKGVSLKTATVSLSKGKTFTIK